MGEYLHTFVDLDATAADAGELANRGRDWLIREQIVRAELTDCTLREDLGNPPGDQWAKAALDQDQEPMDGLGVQAGRTVFCGGQGDVDYATCPQCTARTWFFTEDRGPLAGVFKPFNDAIEVWQATGEARVACSACTRFSELTRWRWERDYFAFGYLGFEFWNWPEFDPGFAGVLGQVLGGHQIVVVEGKL